MDPLYRISAILASIKTFFLLIGFIVGLFILSMQPVRAMAASAAGPVVDVVAFVREGCVHCEAEEEFLRALQKDSGDIAVQLYRLENEKDRVAWEDFTARLSLPKVTPITVIGRSYLIGFDSPKTTGNDIRALIGRARQTDASTDLMGEDLTGFSEAQAACDEGGLIPCRADSSVSVSVPLLGRLDTTKYPLVVLSAILGFFDGFNPCAMWVLVSFLIILLQAGSRRRMLLFAGTFVVAEAIMYTLILTVWYKTWDFVRLDQVVTPIVGVVAIAGGALFLNEWRKKEMACKITDPPRRRKTMQKLQELATSRFTIITFLAILGIAFSVNIIEFACSIGIPQAFTKILELNQLSRIQTAGLIVLYIFFYMIDDFIVFVIALIGADTLSITTKYSKQSNLIGGIVMIILGVLLLWKPQMLLF